MIELTLIGIGTGDPAQLTLAATRAIAGADLLLLPLKGEDKADLAQLRRQMAVEWGAGARVAEFDLPTRDAAGGYLSGVDRWHDAIAAAWESRIRAHLDAGGGPLVALLVWGDPSLYDSSLRIAERVGRRLPLRLRVIPGITAIQALCAAHAIPLNRVGAPVQITTARRLRDDGWPAGSDSIVVMLDSGGAFRSIAADGVRIWWGAFLGMPEQILLHGPLAEVADRIEAARAEARTRHGWIMDIYLLRRGADA